MPVVLGLAAMLLLGASVAYAAIPGRDGAINGCVSERTGVLRVIDSAKGQRCIERPAALRETPIVWNQRGPAGPPGAGGGGLASLDQLAGLPCDVNSAKPGVTLIRYFSGPVSLYCQKPGEPDVTAPRTTTPAPTPATTESTSSVSTPDKTNTKTTVATSTTGVPG